MCGRPIVTSPSREYVESLGAVLRQPKSDCLTWNNDIVEGDLRLKRVESKSDWFPCNDVWSES